MDPADTLLSARDLEGLPEDEPSPDDLELLERVREDRVRKRRLRRSLAVCAMAAIVLAATLLWTRRATDERIASDPPTVAETPAAPAANPVPETARPVVAAPESVAVTPSAAAPPPAARAISAPPTREPTAAAREPAPPRELPSREPASRARAEREPARRITARTRVPDPMRPDATESQPADSGTDAQRLELPPRVSAAPTDTPPAAPAPIQEARTNRNSSPPDVRVVVAQKVDGSNVDYTVRLFQPGGSPVTDADVRLRGVTADGVLVEAPLQPAGPPGVYHALLAFSPRGPRGLTLRIARADGVLEVPVAPAPGGSSPSSR